MEGVDQISDAILPFREFWALQSPGSPGMPIDCMYRDAGSVGLSELPQLHSRLPVHSCLMMSKPPPPPRDTP